MKEMLCKIASVWASAFIVVFVMLLIEPPALSDDVYTNARHRAEIMFVFAGAVTGLGWLLYRSDRKDKL